MTIIKWNDKEFYIDNKLREDLNRIKEGLQKKDRDYMLIVDGEEGEGKSVFSQQLCAYMDSSFTEDKMCMGAEEFMQKVNKAERGTAICFDEAFVGLSSRSAMSVTNKLMVSLLMRMRQKNLFVVITLPTIFMLDQYAALWRAKGLFHIYSIKGRRGRWVFFNKRNMRLLHDYGSQKRTRFRYNFPKTNYFGRFYDQYLINEAKYKKNKEDTLITSMNIGESNNINKYKVQRDDIVRYIVKTLGESHTNLANYLKSCDFPIGRRQISDICRENP